jgi:Xaa-Pro aminopeptidase
MSFVKLPILRHGLMVRHQEILPDMAVAGRVEMVRQWMFTRDVECLLIYSDPTKNGPVCYLTNYPCYGLGRRATVVLGSTSGPFLFTAEPSRNLPRVRLFTTCDIEKTRQFLSAASERARKICGDGSIGLVGIANLPLESVKDTEKLSDLKVKDLSHDFSALLSVKDESSLKATRRALELAEAGIKLLSDQAASGKDLWQLAAYVDYHLRLGGCEDTNILLNSSSGGYMRPGYPARMRPLPGDTLIAYVAVQYARHWGVAGSTLTVGTAGDKLHAKLALMRKVQKKAASEIKAGMTLGEAASVIWETGRQEGLAFAEDVPLATGVGFDLHEYPLEAVDRVEKNTVLQVALTVDFAEGFTGMLVNMLQIKDNDSLWLTSVS